MKRKLKKGEITDKILQVVKMTSVLSVAMVAPNALRMFDLFKENDRKKRYYIKTKTQKMIDQGLLEFKNKGNKKVLILTEEGEKRLQKYKLLKQGTNNKKWDGKWRVIAYDIWENNKGKRDLFRQELKEFGFQKLQNSVWIYPYDCEDFIKLLKADKKFGDNVRYFLAEKIENDKKIKKSFGLI